MEVFVIKGIGIVVVFVFFVMGVVVEEVLGLW